MITQHSDFDKCMLICIFGTRVCSQSQYSKSSGSPILILLQFILVHMKVESGLLYSFQKLNLEEHKCKLFMQEL